LRIVLDTNALIRAHRRISSRARRLLEQLLQGGHDLILSNEMLAEATKVLRYPRFQSLYGLTDADLLDYTQFLQSISHLVALDPQYRAPLRDPNDLIVLQTAERGEADILCTDDGDFFDPTILSYFAARGIEVCDEAALLERLTLVN
jgi:putative PIN family toxin of toxin-antitoxin system